MSIALAAEVKTLAQAVNRPSLTALSYSLRHPETWPAGFVWDYSNCKSCAVGLAAQLWSLTIPREQIAQETMIAQEMMMSLRHARRIFFGLGTRTTKGFLFWKKVDPGFRAVTPDDVADAIDHYLKVAG